MSHITRRFGWQEINTHLNRFTNLKRERKRKKVMKNFGLRTDELQIFLLLCSHVLLHENVLGHDVCNNKKKNLKISLLLLYYYFSYTYIHTSLTHSCSYHIIIIIVILLLLLLCAALYMHIQSSFMIKVRSFPDS